MLAAAETHDSDHWTTSFWFTDNKLIEHGLTSPPTQYRLYGRRFFFDGFFYKTATTASKPWSRTGWATKDRKKSPSFPGLSKAINLVFDKLLQQEVNVLMTFVKGHSTFHIPGYPCILTWSCLGTCESFFFVRIESAVRFVFESNLRIESAVYHTSRNTA